MINEEHQYLPAPAYKSLQEIRMRKQMLKKDIRKDDKLMKDLFGSIFKPAEAKSTLPTKRFGFMMNTGAGILDGLILGWKLYRKFKKKK